MRRLNKLTTNRIERAFDGADMTLTQWITLALIATDTANTCTTLARDLGHDSGAMTRVLDQLEERGLVVRTRDDSDRRVTRVTVSDSGREAMMALVTTVVGEWNLILADFDRDEIDRLIATMTRLLARLDALETEEEMAS